MDSFRSFTYSGVMIEVKHLRLVAAIERHGTLSGAAREMGLSQPAITQQMQRLEKDLGTPLVTKQSRGVTLTSAGRVLLRHSGNILPALSRAESEIAAIAGLRGGEIRISSFASGAASLLPRALAWMNDHHEGITFRLLEAETEESLQKLRNGDCEVALVYEYHSEGMTLRRPDITHDPDEIWETAMEEQIWLAMPHAHPLAEDPEVDIASLEGARWISGCPSCQGNLVDVCSTAGYRPDITYETDDYIALQGFAAAGLGVALLPELMIQPSVHDDDLVLKPLKLKRYRRVSVVTTRALSSVPGVMETMQAIVDVAQEISGRGRPAVAGS